MSCVRNFAVAVLLTVLVACVTGEETDLLLFLPEPAWQALPQLSVRSDRRKHTASVAQLPLRLS